jgi:hypothetical protein
MAQQTAVDIMFEKAISVLPLGAIDAKYDIKETYLQAKEMEKQQIMEAYIDGYEHTGFAADAEQYYTETYGI